MKEENTIESASKDLKDQIEEIKEDEKMFDERPEYPWNRKTRRRVLGLKKYNFSRRVFSGKRIQGLSEKIMTSTIRQAQLDQIMKTTEE